MRAIRDFSTSCAAAYFISDARHGQSRGDGLSERTIAATCLRLLELELQPDLQLRQAHAALAAWRGICALQRRVPALECVCRLSDAGPDSDAALSDARWIHVVLGGENTAEGRSRLSLAHTMSSVAIGCDVRYARDLVYADGLDVDRREIVVPVGITCRLCERTDCEQRAFPSLRHPLKIDEHVRGLSFYGLWWGAARNRHSCVI